MTIRSIDMQVLVQKATDVSKIQHTQQIQNAGRQQENAAQIMQQTEVISKSVNQTKETEAKRVHEEKEKKEKGKGKRGKSSPAPEDSKESGSDHPGIDIIA